MADPIVITILPEDVPAELYAKIRVMSKSDIIYALKSHKSISATYSGQIGEAYVEDILRAEYNVLNVSKTGHCGDLLIKHNNVRVLIEIKNYSNAIPTSEITKFNKDLGFNNAGVFISLGSKISGHPDFDFITEYGESNIPVLFLNSAQPQVILRSVALVVKYAECVQTMGYTCPGLKKKLVDLRNQVSGLQNVRECVNKTRESLDHQLIAVTHSVLELELNLLHSIDAIIESLSGSQNNIEDLLCGIECDAALLLRQVLIAFSKLEKGSFTKPNPNTVQCSIGNEVALIKIYKHHFVLQIKSAKKKITKTDEPSHVREWIVANSPSIANFSLEL